MTLSCQSVSSKTHQLTTYKVLYEGVKITPLSLGSSSTFFPPHMYFLRCNCTKTRKTPLSELLLVAVLQCFYGFWWLWEFLQWRFEALKTCWGTLGIDISGIAWGKMTNVHVTWRRMASYWFGTVGLTLILNFFCALRNRQEDNRDFFLHCIALC